jgi:hypothetical protein
VIMKARSMPVKKARHRHLRLIDLFRRAVNNRA